MKKIVSIHQPSYFTWFGLLDKIIKSDIFIVLDNVQFNKRAFQHRTLYSNQSGAPAYLTLPVDAKNHQNDCLLINEIAFKSSINESLAKHKSILKQRYGKYRGFKLLEEDINLILGKDYHKLIDLIMETLQLLINKFEINTKIIYASQLKSSGTKSELMLNLTKAVDGDIYLSGVGAKDYMNDDIFFNSNIEVIYQEFKHIEYDQMLKKSFQPGCLALELIFLHDDFKSLLNSHYESINQLELIKGLPWIK